MFDKNIRTCAEILFSYTRLSVYVRAYVHVFVNICVHACARVRVYVRVCMYDCHIAVVF